MSGISFNTIGNPYFLEFLKQLRPAYTPPNRKTLSVNFLNDEIININKKIDLDIQKNSNLTLGI
jgi:hypothetical protein